MATELQVSIKKTTRPRFGRGSPQVVIPTVDFLRAGALPEDPMIRGQRGGIRCLCDAVRKVLHVGCGTLCL